MFFCLESDNPAYYLQLRLHVSVWLQATVHECGIRLWSKLYAISVCDIRHCCICLWCYVSAIYVYIN